MHVSKSKRCFNLKSSTYYFHMKTKILADFQICICVPLNFSLNFNFSCFDHNSNNNITLTENGKSTCRKTTIIRSNSLEMLLAKGVLKKCRKFTGEYPCRSVISIKLLAWVLSCKFAAYFQNTFSYKHLWMAASK